MRLLTIAGVTAISSLLLAATPQDKAHKEMQSIYNTGQKSSQLLIKTLGKNMKQHMKKGGAMDALDFCSNEAYSLTEDVNKKLPKGVSVKRVSLQHRNPGNTPAPDEAKILATLQELQNEGVVLPHQLVQKVNANTYKYYKPLRIAKKVCLKCHGDIQNDALKKAIASRYPNDKATGYKMGDLRGAIVVTIKK